MEGKEADDSGETKKGLEAEKIMRNGGKESEDQEKKVSEEQENVTPFDSISQHGGSCHTTISSLSSRAKAAAKKQPWKLRQGIFKECKKCSTE